jgi:pimeloyl-ACP methyl ester carboxylesterase
MPHRRHLGLARRRAGCLTDAHVARSPFVLVHGGAHGAWCWEPLLPHLRRQALAVDLPPKSIRGVPSSAVVPPPELGTVGIDDFATSVLHDVDAAGIEQFVLVGHSMAGLTIPEVAARAPERVEHLVFISCLIPPDDGSIVDALPEDTREMTHAVLDEIRAGGSNVRMGGLDDATLTAMFCNDMDEEQRAFVLAHTGVEAPRAFETPVSRAGLPPDIPKTYIRLARDQALTPPDQERQIANLRASPGGDLRIVDLDTGHDVMISAPALLAELLETVAP